MFICVFPIIFPLSFADYLFTLCDVNEVTKTVTDRNVNTEEHDQNDSAETQIMKLDYELQNDPSAMDNNKTDDCGNFLDDDITSHSS